MHEQLNITRHSATNLKANSNQLGCCTSCWAFTWFGDKLVEKLVLCLWTGNQLMLSKIPSTFPYATFGLFVLFLPYFTVYIRQCGTGKNDAMGQL